jgi:DNA polymerase-3 subunit chi
MAEVWFYHLERTALEQALPELLEKTLARGWSAQVRCRTAERAAVLDGALWTYREDSFLPHGLESEPDADRQPVVLGTGEGNPNAAQALFLIDDAEPGSLDGFARTVVFIDGRDPAAVAAGRSRWTSLKAAGASLSYWQQKPEGGWEKRG